MMLHIHFNHPLLGYLRCVSSEEKDIANKQYKSIYHTTNKHVDQLDPQVLTMWNSPSCSTHDVMYDNKDNLTSSQSIDPHPS